MSRPIASPAAGKFARIERGEGPRERAFVFALAQDALEGGK
jgi:hypothetical protein